MITNLPHMKDKTKTLFQPTRAQSENHAELVVFKNSYPDRYYPIGKHLIRIGAAPDNDIIIEDPFVSAHHCEVEKKDALFYLKDTQSKNGTHLNGTLIKETGLQHQCKIEIGKTLIQFQSTSKSPKQTCFEGMLSANDRMQQTFHLIQKVAPSNKTAIIYGETGTGKELVAHALHKLSDRKKRNFVTLNCGAIPKDLLETELFGHVRGAFTGATRNRKGSFLSADGGTLFLDEIGEFPLSLQPKLLRALECGEIKPVGAERPIKVNVRFIAATHRNLPQMIKNNLFREDLFYRLHLIPIDLPSLRERKEDIPLLIKHFTKNHKVTSRALKLLLQYDWPGNIRELKNIMERLLIVIDAPIITEHDVQQVLQTRPQSFTKIMQNTERDIIREFLNKNDWNRTATARLLSLPKSTLLDKMKKYNLARHKQGL